MSPYFLLGFLAAAYVHHVWSNYRQWRRLYCMAFIEKCRKEHVLRMNLLSGLGGAVWREPVEQEWLTIRMKVFPPADRQKAP